MERYLTIEQAANMTHVSQSILIELVSSGKIRANILADGGIIVPENDLRNHMPKENQPAWQKYANLASVEINISAAARKYNIPQQTISRWVARGLINILGHQGRKTLISEADIAYYADIYHQAGGGQGKWVFKDGAIYQKK